MENALSIINNMPSTLDQVARFVSKVKDEALSGEYNPLEVLKQLRMAQKALEILNKDEELEEAAQKEHSKHGVKTLELPGASVTIKEVGVKYDYEACNDRIWRLHKEDESMSAYNRKEREKFLQSIKDPITILNEETGQVETLNPAPKTSSTKLSVTLK